MTSQLSPRTRECLFRKSVSVLGKKPKTAVERQRPRQHNENSGVVVFCVRYCWTLGDTWKGFLTERSNFAPDVSTFKRNFNIRQLTKKKIVSYRTAHDSGTFQDRTRCWLTWWLRKKFRKLSTNCHGRNVMLKRWITSCKHTTNVTEMSNWQLIPANFFQIINT
jgi:hypothetical protein